jgi:membrane AbrB-like protein
MIANLPFRMFMTIAIGGLGGSLFFLLNLPLPWMLGAITITLVCASARVPLHSPEVARPYVVAIIGVMLGSGFQPDTFAHLNQWAVSLVGLLICVAISAYVVQLYLRKWGEMDPVTALFAAMPGGVVEMVEIGRAHGADDRAIILAHICRIVLVIAVVAFWFRLVLGLEVNGTAPLSGKETGAVDLVILALCAVIGSVLGVKTKIPAPTFLGPMVLSAIAHMTGLTAGSPPAATVIASQIMLGVIIGCRFEGVAPSRIFKAFKLAVVSTALMLGVAFGLAFLLHGFVGQKRRFYGVTILVGLFIFLVR